MAKQAGLPATFRKLEGHAISANFREVTSVVTSPLMLPSAKEILVRIIWAGVNASDLNWTNAKYNPTLKPPYDTGMELLGEVVAFGDLAGKCVKLGDIVGSMSPGAFGEYVLCPMTAVVKLPSPDPAFLTILVSGLTASLALEEVGQLTSKETVLVTVLPWSLKLHEAAAGGTGIFAVQLAKIAGNHVVATCSSDDKAEFLKKLGCDRVINYRKENLGAVLKKEYPSGVDIVYESVGGITLDTCVANLAIKGAVADGSAFSGMGATRQEMRLLTRSASIRGFFLNHYMKEAPIHIAKIMKLHAEGKLKLIVDQPDGFAGLDRVADALDHLYAGKNIGKVVVKIADHKANL